MSAPGRARLAIKRFTDGGKLQSESRQIDEHAHLFSRPAALRPAGNQLGQRRCRGNVEAFDGVAVLRQNTEICLSVMRGLVRRLRSADRKIETLALLDVYGRVARVFLDSSEIVDGDRVVRNRLPRQQIAKMVGASREMVSRVMKGLEAEGYIFPLDEGRILLREKLSLYL